MELNLDFRQDNRRETERLRSLLALLKEEELAYPLGNGWTVGTALAHLAFWDRQRLALLQRWGQSGVAPAHTDQDSINEAVKALAEALPPRRAAALALEAAVEMDRALEKLPPDLARAIAAGGHERVLRRSVHRKEHLDQIEAALKLHSRR